jgi:hypothetical protein
MQCPLNGEKISTRARKMTEIYSIKKLCQRSMNRVNYFRLVRTNIWPIQFLAALFLFTHERLFV